jgi:hypothetical protein
MTGSHEERGGRVPTRVWVTAGASFVLGVGLVVAGGVIHGFSSYLQSVFVNVGTAFALLAPLVVGERLLNLRVLEARASARSAVSTAEEARTLATEARTEVSALDERVRAGLAAVRAEHDDLVVQTAAADRDALVELYERAAARNSIDRRGLRVGVEDEGYAIRVRVIDRAPDEGPETLVELLAEDRDLRPIGRVVMWAGGEDPASVFLGLATELQHAGAWFGDEAFSAEEILAAISRDLRRVIDIRTGPAPQPSTRPIIELIGDWAITRQGLDSVRSDNLWAEHDELIGDTHHAFQRLENQVKLRDLDTLQFRKAFTIAEHVHAALESDGPGRIGTS